MEQPATAIEHDLLDSHGTRPLRDGLTHPLGSSGFVAVGRAEIGGRHRLQDHHFWLSNRAAVPLLLRRRGRVIGYCLVQLRSPVVLRHPDAATIGPLGVRSPEDCGSAVGAALRWAGARREIFTISLPAASSALPAVLRAGLRIVYTETFLSAGAPFFDPARYIASGGELF